MNLYEKQRTEMHWNRQKVKDLATNHINNIIKMLKPVNNTQTYGAYTKEVWIKVLNDEIKYRNKMGNAIINHFPSIKNAVKNQLKLAI